MLHSLCNDDSDVNHINVPERGSSEMLTSGFQPFDKQGLSIYLGSQELQYGSSPSCSAD